MILALTMKFIDMPFGVRKYDGGRFLSIDPLWEKYLAWSPYHYCGNNPVNATDGNGMYIEFYKGNEELAIPGTTQQDIKNYDLAKTYVGLFIAPWENNPINQIEVSPMKFTVMISSSLGDNFFDAKGQVDPNYSQMIGWCPTSGLLLENATSQTPANELVHEFGHASQWLLNRDIFTKTITTDPILGYPLEEDRNLKEVENPFSKRAYEGIRLDYNKGELIRVSNPLSNKELDK